MKKATSVADVQKSVEEQAGLAKEQQVSASLFESNGLDTIAREAPKGNIP